MVSDQIDMSLDDIIASNKKTRGGRGSRGGGRSRGRGSARGGAGGRGGRGRRDSTGPTTRRGRGGDRSTPYSRPRNIPDKWEHDMYDGAGGGAGRRGGKPEGLTTGSHLQISNLDFGVTESDVRELFTEFGKLKKAMINYDSSGRSHGTADVVFERRDDAIKAFKTYNGVPLDGRAMKIEQVTPQVTSNVGRRESGGIRGGNRLGSRNNTGGGSTRSRGFRSGNRGGRGRGGRGGRGGGRKPPPSKDDLDKELDSYIESAN